MSQRALAKAIYGALTADTSGGTIWALTGGRIYDTAPPEKKNPAF